MRDKGRSANSDLISLDAAKGLITSGQVAEIFQPHQGGVVLILRNVEIKAFKPASLGLGA